MAWIIGVDVGGTFTDFYALDAARGVEYVQKVPSTPSNPARAILDGVERLCRERSIAPGEVVRLAHGTTVATNALIQRRGADVAVITTRGFRDLLEIGRQIRPKLFDFQVDNPAPLAPRELRFEVAERIGSRGEVVEPLTDDAIAAVVEAVRASGAGAVAVCLLFSFLNGDHERAIGASLERVLPDLVVSLSSEVQPEFREYERFSTALLNAYLQPLLSTYMTTLERDVAQRLPSARLGINQSSGGLMSVARARRFPIRTALSGPAAGAVGAVHAGRVAGCPDVITLDMGGTSADVCLIRGHDAGVSFTRDVAGFPVRLPMIDINTVGAGGGSIAWFDRDGLLKVGPRSAGADPGPACYGHGGTEPTVTDANVVLGRLSPAGLLGGAMPVDVDAARRSLEPVAERLGYGVEHTAIGVLGIVAANMVRAIRAVSVERGHDPREFVLMPFGGAGALHARRVAHELGIRRIVVPPSPGILCAQGLVVSDLKEDFVRSARVAVADDAIAGMRGLVEELVDEARTWFAAEDVAESERELQLTLDMRYLGQNFELRVAAAAAGGDAAPTLPQTATLLSLFADAHERTYGFSNPGDAVEVVNFRLTALGRHPIPPPARAARSAPGGPAPASRRAVYFESAAAADTPVYDRASLLPGQSFEGPAIVEQLDATTVADPGDRVRVDEASNLVIDVAPS